MNIIDLLINRKKAQEASMDEYGEPIKPKEDVKEEIKKAMEKNKKAVGN